MHFILTATLVLSISYGTTAIKGARKKQTAATPSEPQLEPHPSRLDLKENQLSADILSMQRRIREDKQSERDAKVGVSMDGKPEDHAAAPDTTSKRKKTTEMDVRMSRKDHWEKTKLEDVKPCDLEAMDLTGLSPSLLAHPVGSSVDYTKQEREMMMALLEEEASKERDLRRDVMQWMSDV